jgi:hypothetical protein
LEGANMKLVNLKSIDFKLTSFTHID